MRLKTLGASAALSILTSGLAAGPLLARNEAAYSSSMPQTYPRAYALWRSHLPRRYRRVGWAARFAGQAMPIRAITRQGRPRLFFQSCKPRLCNVDEVDAVVAPDGDRAFGVILDHGRPISVGGANPTQKACLRAFAETLQSRC
jgi:hypothetical protein